MGNEMESHFQSPCQLTSLGLGFGNYIEGSRSGEISQDCVVFR